MILDPLGRYVGALSGTTLWRLDRRWRRRSHFQLLAGPGRVVAGAAAVLVVGDDETSVTASVSRLDRPDLALALARWDGGGWTFDGDRAAWAQVPEYVLISRDGRTALLRIADDAVIDPLDEVDYEVADVVVIPDSRLVVLTGGGRLTVYDAIAGRSVSRLRLAGGAERPTVRFRLGGDEAWVDDGDTLVKFDKQWQVVDGAGSERPPTATEPRATIGAWSFVRDGLACLVVRPVAGDVLLLDASTMEVIAIASPTHAPIDALLSNDHVITVDVDGRFRRTRLAAVDTPLAGPVDHQGG